ncbi:MAG: hypothetical protein Q9165_004652 [Trypethelium subeluteriae]
MQPRIPLFAPVNIRHATLTSVATNAVESTVNLNSAYAQEPDSATGFAQASAPLSPPTPYSPGMRSSLSRQKTNDDAQSAEIQMSNFQDGLPPPPPVSHTWKRIDRWAEDNYEELFENICEGATQNDTIELEHELDCTLPQDVRDSIQIHDGQERGGRPTGLIFGCMLLDCEEIVQEWNNWRIVNEEFLVASRPNNYTEPQAPLKAFAGAESSSSPTTNAPQQGANAFWREQLLAKQDSQPPNAVQKAYAHPAWIPLARDWGGNNIAVDLAPGPTGKWGQVILMGRDYDCKYVISRSWASFLATLADDLSTDKWWVDEESKELKLREFKNQAVEPAYMDILRWRSDQKYGRKVLSSSSPSTKRKGPPPGGLHINANVAGGQAGASPYSSPVSAGPDRGRSPSRFAPPGSAKNPSPRPNLSSPLARVTEESATPLKLQTQTDAIRKNSATEKLVSVDTPRASGDFSKFAALSNGKLAVGVEALNKENISRTGPTTTEKVPEESAKTDGEELKTVEI